jgi:hypothetical protein
MPKRKAKKSRKIANVAAKKKTNIKPIVFVVAAVVVVALAMMAMSMNPGYVPAQSDSQQSNQNQIPGLPDSQTTQPCKSDLQCFVATCKNTPTVWTCINAINVDMFYRSCNPAKDSNVITPYYDTTKCKCINGNCRAL